MHSVLESVRRLSDQILSLLVSAAMGVLTLDVLWGVVSRYLKSPAPWTDELATTLLIWVAMLGGALVYGERGHLGVDYFVGKLDPGAQKLADIVVQLLVLGFALGVMVYGGSVLVERTLAAGQTMPSLGWKKAYVYVAVPLSGLFIVVYAVETLVRDIWPPADVQRPPEPSS